MDNVSIQSIKPTKPFTLVLNETIQTIKDPIALAIYVYLVGKPKNWIVRHKDLMNRFDMSKNSIYKRLKILKELGLYEAYPVRDGHGRVEKWKTVIHKEPNHFPKSENLVNPESGKMGDIVNKDNYKTKTLNNLLDDDSVECDDGSRRASQESKADNYSLSPADEEKLFSLKRHFLISDSRGRDEFMEDCLYHIKINMKKGFTEGGAMRGLHTIIRKKTFTKPKFMDYRSGFATSDAGGDKNQVSNVPDEVLYNNYLMSIKRDQDILKIRENEKIMTFNEWFKKSNKTE